MKQRLAPKPSSRNIDQMNLRLAIYANGWTPMPCEAKGYVLEGWPKMIINEEVIRGWDKYGKGGSTLLGTGLRIEGKAFVVDLDIKDVDVLNRVLAKIEAAYPEFYAGALWRNSGAVSLALFGQVSEPVGGRFSITYGRKHADGTVTDKAHAETYGSATGGKYFAGWGPHKVDGRFYQFEGPSPADTRLDSLPVFDAAEVGPLIDLIEAELAACGLEQIAPGRKSNGYQALYDLTPETGFVMEDGTEVTCADLEAMLEAGAESGIRGVMTLEEWAASESKEHCNAFLRKGAKRLMISDFSCDVHHYYADEQPGALDAAVGETLRMISEQTQAEAEKPHAPEEPRRRAKPIYELPVGADPAANYAVAIAWLGEELVFCAPANSGRGGVYSLWTGGPWRHHPITLTALKTLMLPWVVITGPPSRRKVNNPVDAWLSQRPISVEGRRFRPDLDAELYAERASRFLNIYAPPEHPATGGSTRVFHEFMVHLIPDAGYRELVWLWVAYKMQHPWEPMYTLMMAAPNAFGTGRGTLGVILGRLLGEEYYQEVGFDELTGRSSAARWTAAAIADKLLIMVHEAAGDDEGQRLSVRTAGYERLKLILDPDAEALRTREAKGEMPYQARSATSCIILTNHANPIRFPSGGERRIAVVRNGDTRMSRVQRDVVRTWARDPANIGALWRELRSMKIAAAFDPQEPPMSAAKLEMVELSKTDLDVAWEVARSEIKGRLFTFTQAVELMRAHGDLQRHGDWEYVARRQMTNWAHWLRESASASRVFYQGRQQVVYALEAADRKAFAKAPLERIKAELDATEKSTGIGPRIVLVHSADRAKKGDGDGGGGGGAD